MKNSGEKYSYLPIFCNLRGKSVAVIGGGHVAERKIKGLLQVGALVTVISPETTAFLSAVSSEGLISLIPRNFEPGDLDGTWLVIAATDDRHVQDAVYREAQEKRIFCNVVDEPAVCSFIVPSTVRRGEFCIAISTGGKCPALAKALRKDLEKRFGTNWGLFVSLLGRLRSLVIEDHHGEIANKKCSQLADLEAAEWVKEKEWERLEDWAVQICGKRAGMVVQEFAKDG